MSDNTTIAGAEAVQPVHVSFDELDQFGMLYHSRYLTLVDRAWVLYWASRGYRFDISGDSPDTYAVIREITISYERPIVSYGSVTVAFWMERVGTTSLTMGFRITSQDNTETYAQGRRTMIKVDPATGRPAPWSDSARADLEALLRAPAATPR